MAIFIPEIALFKILEGCLEHVRIDYNTVQDKNKSILAQIFKDTKNVNADYFKEAIALVITKGTPENNRFIKVRQFFDAKRANIPTVHLTIPQDEPGENSIGVDENEQTEEGVLDYELENGDVERRPLNGRRFDTMYSIVFTSDNHSEVTIMYHLFRAILISAFDTMSHVGLQNPKLSGQELKINSELSPPHIYMRALCVRASYDVEIPQWFGNKIIENILTEPNMVDNG